MGMRMMKTPRRLRRLQESLLPPPSQDGGVDQLPCEIMKNCLCSIVQKVLTWDVLDPAVRLHLLGGGLGHLLGSQVVVDEGQADIKVPEEKEIKSKKPESDGVGRHYDHHHAGGQRHHLCLQGVRLLQRQQPLGQEEGAVVVEEDGLLAGKDEVFVLLRDGGHGAGPLHRLLALCNDL